MAKDPQPDDLTAFRERAGAAEALVEALQKQNRQLQAALAVERASRASEDIRRARRKHHLDQYRISRLLSIFDSLDIPRPSLAEEKLVDFVPDTLLEEVRARYKAGLRPPKDPKDASQAVGEKRKRTDPQPDVQERVKGDTHPDSAPAREPDKQPEQTVESASEQPQVPKGTGEAQMDVEECIIIPADEIPAASPSDEVQAAKSAKPPADEDFADADLLPSSIVDDANPAAECLRHLIGASSIAVFENPRRVKLNICNPDKGREVSFWLAWKDGSMEYTQDTVNMADHVCPEFLKEYAIDFDLAQAPRFLLLVLGAVFDMKIEPKEESTMQESTETGLANQT